MPLLVLGPSSHFPTDSTLSPIPNKHPQMSTPDGCSDSREPQVTRSRLPFHILGFRVHSCWLQKAASLKPTPQPTACHPGRSRSPIFLCVLFPLYPSLSKMVQDIFIYYTIPHLFLWSPECSPRLHRGCVSQGQ